VSRFLGRGLAGDRFSVPPGTDFAANNSTDIGAYDSSGASKSDGSESNIPNTPAGNFDSNWGFGLIDAANL